MPNRIYRRFNVYLLDPNAVSINRVTFLPFICTATFMGGH